MATHNNYIEIINDIKKYKGKKYILTQKKAKEIGNIEIPKSVFDINYIKGRNNELARYIMDNNLNFEVIKPQIIIYFNNK